MATNAGLPVRAQIVPPDSADVFPTHVDIYGKGGHMAVASIADRNAIPFERRKIGMLVATSDTNQLWVLRNILTDDGWSIVQLPFQNMLVVADIGTRDSIAAGDRAIGMLVSVVADETFYVLRGTTDNTGWEKFHVALAQTDSTASNTAAMVVDFNNLLARLRAAGLMES